MMVNLWVTTASPRQIRGCMYRGSARVSYCIRASQYSTSSLHVGYTRVCTVYSMCVWARQLLLYCSTIVSTRVQCLHTSILYATLRDEVVQILDKQI